MSSSDFEIDASPTGKSSSISYEEYQSKQSYAKTKKTTSLLAPSTNDDDENMYDYEVGDVKNNTGSGKASYRGSYKTNKSPNFRTKDNKSDVSASTNPMDKAAQMLAKYDKGPAVKAGGGSSEVSRGLTRQASSKKMPTTTYYNEDEISLDDDDSDEDDSDVEDDEDNEYSFSLSKDGSVVNKKKTITDNPKTVSVDPVKFTKTIPRNTSEFLGNVKGIDELEGSISYDNVSESSFVLGTSGNVDVKYAIKSSNKLDTSDQSYSQEDFQYTTNKQFATAASSSAAKLKFSPAIESVEDDEEFEDMDMNERYGIDRNGMSSAEESTIEEDAAVDVPKIVSFADIEAVTGVAPAAVIPAPVYQQQSVYQQQPVYQQQSQPQAAVPIQQPLQQQQQWLPPPGTATGTYPYPYYPSPYGYAPSSLPTQYSAEPIIMDLLQQLKQAKEEASWAKNRLAEMIALVQKNNNNNNNDPSSNRYGGGYSGNKGSFGRRSPRDEVRVKDRAEEVEEECEEEEEYSADFETSALNNSADTTNSKGSRTQQQQRKTSTSDSSKRDNSNNNSSRNSKPFAAAMNSNHINDPRMQAIEEVASMMNRNPSSLSMSLSTGQELFRRQLALLRERVATANLPATSRIFVPLATRDKKSILAPSIEELKKEFERKRGENKERLMELLAHGDAELTPSDITNIMTGFGSTV